MLVSSVSILGMLAGSMVLAVFVSKFYSVVSNVLLLGAFFSVLLLNSSGLGERSLSSLVSVDSVSSFLIVLSFWISAMMIQSSYFYLKSSSSFVVTVGSLCLVLVMSFSVDSMLLFYIMFEVSLVPTLILILVWGYQPERIQAGMSMFVYTLLGSFPLLVGVIFLSDLNFHSSFFYLGDMGLGWDSDFCLFLVWFVFMLGFLLKVPVYLGHLWLPKAHVEAPVSGSMILAGVLLKLGGYGLIRLSCSGLWSVNVLVLVLVFSICLIGMVTTSMVCLRQSDVKSLIAYSSVGHMALVVVGVVSGTSWGYVGALVMMVSHGVCSSGLFSSANNWYLLSGSRSLFITKGMVFISPVLVMGWFILSASNMSAPSMSLVGEILLAGSGLSSASVCVFGLMFSVFFVGVYCIFLYSQVSHGVVSSQVSHSLAPPEVFFVVGALHWVPLFVFLFVPNVFV
uniref:NADH-ubiquinone oxidoreductase chain 4 n=1 Tax=Terebratalia transversa TaxID=34513 RepID=Q953X1_TERTR|nr:NADH dehydrogenase subunit 4 [Terebratalia transversa]AAK95505.1 NADH dehydrogenase subunit 4 [Terebratalia transversa]